MRIGIGTDIHTLVPGCKLLIGGIHVKAPFGPEAHSDGDVLIHAVIDALLGAAALGDIGELFPPSDDTWKDKDSALLLKSVLDLLHEAGYVTVNVDTVIHLEKPSLRGYKDSIRENLAALMSLDKTCISVKAKSAEGHGAIGLGEAVSADAAVLIDKPALDVWV